MTRKSEQSASSAADLPIYLQGSRNSILSIIIPVLNEAEVIAGLLAELERLDPEIVEIIVVDGGSTDRTVEITRRSRVNVLIKAGGRAIQMNHGARYATGDFLLFLHADSRLPSDAIDILMQYFEQNAVWGRFDVRLSGASPMFRIVEKCMNLRSRLTGIATGDQCIFVRKRVFGKLGGYPEIPLMEDIALSKRLKKIARPVCLKQIATTSSRRWEQNGVFRTILLMWTLRLLYFLGLKPRQLARWYN